MTGRWDRKIAALICFVTAAGFIFSRLAFAPVPWPDGSAFYLPGLYLMHWPPHWRIHAQAAFIPSYDSISFNIQPTLSFFLAVVGQSGLASVIPLPYLLKIFSLTALFAWAWLLWEWLREALTPLTPLRPGQARLLASVVTLAALWDPVVRWGTLVVRTETWIGLCWLFIVRELERRESGRSTDWKKTARRISIVLALLAYIHYEAVFFVPAVIVGLGFEKGWFRRLLDIGLRTTLLLSPWILCVLLNLKTFLEQMEIQFHRLAHANHWMANPYMIFHSLFVDHGSPSGWPKFFNLGKGVFWLALVVMTIQLTQTFVKAPQPALRRRIPWTLAGTATAFVFTFYLWATKAEIWFVTLIHLAFWPWIGMATIQALASERNTIRPLLSRGLVGLSGVYAFLALAATFAQSSAISPGYTWPMYEQWIDCMERQLGPLAQRPNLKIWQPHVPDILVELSWRHPGWDLTRSLDFQARRPRALQAGRTMDAIFFTRNFNPAPPGAFAQYEGPLRPDDREKMAHEADLPFGPWGLNELPLEVPGTWQTRVCEIGPFWAAVLVQNKAGN